ncbi:MAG: cadherin-like domain-containing protein, partial [bacterium]|nr:cadherin-like domain-containing protein [bacterium]
MTDKDKKGKGSKRSPRKTLQALEKRMMLDATISGLAANITLTETQVNVLQPTNRDFDFVTPTILSGTGEDGQVTIGGSTNSFDGVNLRITTTGGINDQLYISRTRQTVGAQGATDIAVYNFAVAYGGVQIGSLASTGGNGVDGNPLIITLNANATRTSVEALIERISFRNISDNPTASRTITYTLDGYFTASTTLNITGVNDAPIMGANTGIRVGNGQTVVVGRGNLLAIDTDSPTLTYTLQTAPTTGILRNNGVALTTGSTFTQANIDAGLITFTNTVAGASETLMGLTVSDGTASIGVYSEVRNGDFATATDWTLGANWTIAGGVASHATGTAGTLLQTDTSLISGRSYTVTYTVTRSAGGVQINIGGTLGTSRTAAGTYTDTITAGASGMIGFSGNATFVGTVDNFSVKLATAPVFATIDNTNNAPSLSPSQVITWMDGSVQYNATNGNYYRLVTGTVGIGTALRNSELAYLNGVAGHLVTITSASENAFINAISAQSLWTAASDTNTESYWTWMAGPEKGQVFYVGLSGQGGAAVNGAFNQWNNLEPNDYLFGNTANGSGFMEWTTSSPPGEEWLEWQDGGNWNDNQGPYGYVIEWEGADLINNLSYRYNYNNPATDIVSGSIMGTVQGGDQENSTLGYAITGGTGLGLFSVNAATGRITVLDAASATTIRNNLATSSSYTLIMTVSDGVNTSATQTVTINFNGAPGAGGITNTGVTAPEGAATTITSAMLSIVDNDPPASIIFRVTDAVDNGYLQLSTSAGTAVTSFTLADIQANLVQYVHNGSETTADAFTFTISDPSATSAAFTFNITVAQVNDAPVVNFADSWTVAEVLAAHPGVSYNATTNSFYRYISGNLTFTAAQSASAAYTLFGRSGALANITSSTENTYIDGLLGTNSAWLGGADTGQEGVWRFTGGTENGQIFSSGPFTYLGSYINWAAGEPSNTGGNQNYQVMNTVGTWEDRTVNDATVSGYVIEWDASVVLPSRIVYTLAENTAAGTYTADAGSTDAEPSQTATYSISSGNVGGAFTINSATGLITVAGTLDYETTPFIDLVIRATDNGTPNLYGEQTIRINLTDVNEAPIVTVNSFAVDEGVSTVIPLASLTSSDEGAPSGVVYTVTTGLTNGYLSRSSAPTTPIVTFTQAELNANAISYVHNGTNTLSDSFVFSVSDGTFTVPNRTFSITVRPGNDAPQGTNNTVTIFEDTPYTFSAANFGFSDPNDSPSNTFAGVRITTLPTTGILRMNGVAVVAGDTVTAADIALNRLVFTPAANTTGAGNSSFTFQVQDNGGTANSGVEYDQSPNTFTFNVTALNDAPAGTDTTVTFFEDTIYTFTTANFGFTDAADTPANTFLDVRISSLPTAGTLTYNGVAVTVGQVVTAADVTSGLLRFTPAANGFGATYSTFTFQVRDNGGTVSGGVDLDASANTMTMSVTGVNDAPAGTNGTVTTLEDTTLVFSVANFGFTDPTDAPSGNALSFVVLTTLPALGTILLNGVAVTAGQSISAANIASNLLTYQPVPNANGAGYSSFTFQVRDSGGTANGGVDLDASPNTMTINVTSVNDAPAGADATVSTLEDTAYVFTTANFGFTDPNDTTVPNTLLEVRITTLPATGALTLNGAAVLAGDLISVANITGGLLRFTPAANANGAANASFTFQVRDNGGTASGGVDLDASANTMTINVTAVNDAPTGTNNTVTILEDATYTFSAASFGFGDASDTPANTLLAVRVTTLPLNGILRLSGVPVVAGDFIPVASIGSLVFTPNANANGAALSSFTFQVQDNGGTANGGVNLDAIARTFTFNVTSVNDAPAGADATIVMDEGSFVNLTLANFGFTDASDTPANAFQSVLITTLPTAGSLTLNGVAVTAGTTVTVIDISSGLLRFTPAVNGTGATYSTFTFQVRDNGGTANGGVDLDPTANTITFSVTAINDEPVGTNNTVTILEDTAYTFTTAVFGFSDPTDSPANTLLEVRITTLPATGILRLNGVAVTAGQNVTATDIGAGLLVFTPAADANGLANASFTFQVRDNGGTANGGVDLDQSPNTFTFNVTAVNDAPAGTDTTVTVLEDNIYTFTAANFGFTDLNDAPAPNTLLEVRISTLPAAGTLTLNGVAVTANQLISVANINSGLLRFTPVANGFGAAYASFTFQVRDNGGGTDIDLTPNTMTVAVTPVNDAPAGTDTTVTATEDTQYTFTAANFGFTDPTDAPSPNAFANVIISALPAIGSLTLNGVAVTAGQTITAAQIAANQLRYQGAANGNGAGYASFTFRVQDDGGTANSGVDTDATPNTMTINVTAVNDAPAGADTTVTTLEDTAYAFTAANFGFTDTSDTPANTLFEVRISTLPVNGTLTLSGVAVTTNQMISVANINSGLLLFTPAANANGATYASFTFQVRDNGGGTDIDLTPNTMTIAVTSVNDAPAGTDRTVTTDEDIAFIFGLSDFGFTDPSDITVPNALANVIISALPALGTLTLNGVAVTLNQSVTAAQITAGQLRYQGASGGNGLSYASFTFRVQDDGGTANSGIDTDATPNTMTVNVTALNDAPQGTDTTVTTLEDTAYAFTVANFGFSDPNDSPANTFLDVRITTLPVNGTLRLSGVAVTAGQDITAANIASGLLTFTPVANANGAGYASFTFQVRDNGGTTGGGVERDQSANTMTVNVTAVNDAPDSANATVTTLEDTAYVFTTANFALTDATDTPANTLSAVVISTLPATGVLRLNGVAVTANQNVTAVDIASGLLTFTPAANANGLANASFTFQVRDSGGTANGGIDLDATPNTMTVNVTSVNDAPAGVDTTVTTAEDTAYTFTTANFGFTDPNDAAAPNAFLSVTITTLPAAGTLTLNGVAVTANQSVTVVDINLNRLVFTPVANANGATYASFTFQVRDNGGGTDIDLSPNTMTVAVTPVNDAPAGTNNAVTTLEDTAYTFTAANFGFTDPIDTPANTFLSVTITTLPAAGTLTLNGVAVTANQSVTVVDINLNRLVFTPVANANGAGYASFTFQVRDNGGGTDIDLSPNTMTVNVTAVNDAPAGTNATVTTLEDTQYIFTTGNFGFTDPTDTPANTLLAVTITTLPLSGTLTLNGVAVTANQSISAANIAANLLRFTPAANANGAANASFTFQVQDNGGTANGGVDLDATPNTMTIDVTPVNDAPAGTNATVIASEDTLFIFTAANFGFTDPADTPANALSAVTITTIPGAGTLTLNGVAVTAGQSVTVANINAGLLRFQGALGASGTNYANFTFQVRDDGGTVNGGVDLDPTANTMTIDVTGLNDAPSGTDTTVTTLEDTAYTFSTANFGFADLNDSPANNFLSVTITTLPLAGTLRLNGVAVTAGQSVTVVDINLNRLVFTPVANANGATYASFTFQVRDDGGTGGGGIDTDASANTMTIAVTSVNDAPAGTNNTVTAVEDTAYTFTTANFGFSDPTDTPANTLFAVTIATLPGSGSLTLNGVAVTANQSVTAVDITSGLLRFTPAANANGAANASFTFQVRDNGGTANGGIDLDATPNTMTIDVTPVNDAPAGTNTTVTTLEDSQYTFTAANFGFTDPNDTPANTLSAVTITALPVLGALTLNGVAVTAGQSISAANIGSGLLRYAPAANGNGAAYATFTFQVQDNGGGADIDLSPNTMTVAVTPVNDAPAGTSTTVTALEDTAYTFTAANFGFTDPTDTPANALSAVIISTLPAAGTLTLNGVAVTANQVVTAADITAGLLRFQAASNASGAGYANFTFQVRDDGGTANGGVDTDASPNTMTVNVTAVNDAPVGANNTVTTLEDTAFTFTTANFGFSDPNDTPANALSAVVISTLPLTGTLTLNGIAVTAGQAVSAANIGSGLLLFTPAANANGLANASFTFRVRDDGGTANSGVDTDATARTMTVNVTSVNDAPAGTNTTVSMQEDTQYTFTAANFGFTDPNDAAAPNAFLSVTISALPAVGSLTLNGVAVTLNQIVTVVDINAGLLRYRPVTDAHGSAYATFGFQVRDNGGTANSGVDLDASPNILTIDVVSVDDAPSGADTTVTMLEDASLTLALANFVFADPNDSPADNFLSIFITTLPALGVLRLNGVAVTAGQEVLVTDINANRLVYTPPANANGAAYTSFTFQLKDDGSTAFGGEVVDASPNTLTISITPVNDAPAGTNATVTALEDTAYTFTAANFGFTDPNDTPADTLQSVMITTIPAAGTLTLNGVAVVAGSSVSLANINAGLLRFTAAANANGAGYANFTFQVRDTGGTANGGIDLDATPNTLTIDVTAVNDAPAGTNNTVTTLEDTQYTFTTANFGFTDPTDTPANALLAVTITALPLSGSLTLNGVAVTAGQSVTAANITAGLLRFTPAANANGAANASFTFQVRDDGGTANGGVDLDPSANTMTINVTSVNDAPAGTDATVTTLEDSQYTFTAANFGFTDVSDTPANALLSVTIAAIPAAGTLTLNGVAVTAGQSVTVANINAGLLRFTPAANANGAGYANFTFQVRDDGGTANGGVDTDATANTMTINVTAVNDAPSGTNNTVIAIEDTGFAFTAAQFGFSDASDTPANTLLAVTITTLPAAGTLRLNGVAVTAGQSVSVANINSSLLVYTPGTGGNGSNYANFTFQVQDNGGITNGGIDLDATPNTMTIDVVSINDAPAGTDATVTTLEDATYTFTTANFGFTDPNDTPANTLLAVRITTLPGAGSLLLNGVAVTAGQFVTALDISAGLLRFAPAANANGAGYANFTFQVQDNGGTANGGVDLDQSANTMTINVTSVNDAPAGTDTTVTTLEDSQYTFTAANFGFTDASDTPANALLSVTITTIPAAGTLTLNGVAVTAGNSISIANINAGLLRFSPAANANGAGYANFTFQVRDDGGTANGGVDTDATANTMTINVTPVNDVPSGTDTTVTTLEDAPYTFTVANFGLTDANDTPANALSAVIITALPGAGTLTLNGSAVTAGQVVSAANIASGLLRFTPAANANGAGYANFTFQVRDDGGTANGGVDTDASPNTMTVNVTSVNDAPAGTDTAVTTLEDTQYTFTTANFGFSDTSDTPANALLSVTITTLPVNGTLTLNGLAMSAGQSVAVASITGGLLRFTPAANANGAGYANFTFQVRDDGGTANGGVDLDPSANTMTINVTPVNDAPAGTDATVTTLEDAAYTFTTANFGFTDPNDTPANTLLSVTIATLPAAGALTLNGVAVTAGQVVTAVDIASGLLRFTPVANANGGNYANFTFQVRDNGGTANGGADIDATANTMTINVTGVNDAPAGTDTAITTLEDTPYTFTAANFGFTDVNDTPANTLLSVTITTLPIAGSLRLNGVAVTAGQSITAVDINAGLLVFSPVLNANGAGYGNFTFQVRDNGGTANSGADIDASANTMTVNVTAVDDAPVIAANAGAVTNEGGTITITTASLSVTDVDTLAANLTYNVSGGLTRGHLELSTAPGVAVTSFTQADIAANRLIYVHTSPGVTPDSFTFSVADATTTIDPFTFNVTIANVNDAPVGTNTTVSTLEDTQYTFSAANFGFTDPNDTPANTLLAVRISTLPVTGTLTLNGVAVTTGQTVSAANINAGLLRFAPAANANGAANATFTFQVQDNGGTAFGGVDLDPTPNTMTIDVTSVNDAPAGTNTTITTLEDTQYTFSAANFGFTDPVDSPENALAAVRITTVPATGSLTLNGVAVTAGQFVTAADIAGGLLQFAPALNANGAANAVFTFQVQDDGGTANGGVDLDASANTLTINVTAVNDAPAGTNTTVTALEDTAFTFTAANFGFTDPNDTPANTLSAVTITTLPATGILTLNGVAVTAGQSISVANIASGLLRFTPAANVNGVANAAFTFQVQDNGGTANGGFDLDQTPNTMTIDVTAVNDAPSGTNTTVTTLEDTGYAFTSANFGFTDPNDTPANSLSAVRITTLPATGALRLNGIAVTTGQTVTVADINAGLLVFTPAANANGAANTTFTFQVQDNGGTVNSGIDLDQSANTLTIDVTPVNDAPAGTNATVTTLEDTAYSFTAANFGLTDPSDTPANGLFAVTITTLPVTGGLTLNGVAVTVGQSVSAADINAGLLLFTPAANANGIGNAVFTFQVQDNGGTANGGIDLDPTANTMTINVTPVNDAPAGTDNTVTTLEDTAYIFTTANFGFTDPVDAPANTLLAVRITALPLSGTLTLNGVAVTAGQTVSAANITSGLLLFTPAVNANGAANAAFTFQVQDNGGTANGGVDI